MIRNINDIRNAFKGKLVGNSYMADCVVRTLLKFPETIIHFVTSYCWFFSSMEDAWAYTFTGNDLINQHLIFLSDELLQQSKLQIEFTIAHEISHVVLGHKNSILRKQTHNEIGRQEYEADQFAYKYLKIKPEKNTQQSKNSPMI
jgi:Zn-dependent protease with chaperone function